MPMMKSNGWIWGGVLAACLMLLAIELTRSEAPAGQSAPPARTTRMVFKPGAGLSVALPAPTPAVAGSPYEVEQAVQKARARGAGENEVYRLRAAALSTQVIAALTERERAEKLWQQRVDAWHAERVALNQADAAALRALRERLFSADEQKLLDAAEPSGTPQLISGEFAP